MKSAQARASATDAGIIFSAGGHTGSSTDTSSGRALCRAAESGALVRVVRGAFMESTEWDRLYGADKHRLLVLASANALRADTVFSHESAAALLGIRMLEAWPRCLTVTVEPENGIRSTQTVRRVHAALTPDELVSVNGVLCTSPARTVADLARSLPFVDAVAAADSALHRKREHELLALDELAVVAERMAGWRGHKRVQRVLEFATPLSDSVQESRSRVIIHELGFPAPVLQQPWRDWRGFIGETDFWWPDYLVTGEFDGLVKYLDRTMRGNRTPERVIIDEKRREDRIRRLGSTMARWVTDELSPPAQLRSILLEAGLPLLR